LSRPVLAACVALGVPSGSTPAPGTRPPTFFVPGTVQELGEGAPPLDCFSDDGRALGEASSSDTRAPRDERWLRVQAVDGQEAVVGVVAPAMEFPVSVGDVVTIDFRREGATFSPTVGHLELRDGDGALLVWLGFAGRVDDLERPAELVLSRGAEVCRLSDRCFPVWTQHELSASMGGESAHVGYGEQRSLGDFTLTHGGLDAQLGGSANGCADGFIAWAAASVWRTMPE
jgi:hypothetical protein